MKVKVGDEEVHYYQNSETGKVSYDKDYKTKVSNGYYEQPSMNGENPKGVVKSQHNQNVDNIDRTNREQKDALSNGEVWKAKE